MASLSSALGEVDAGTSLHVVSWSEWATPVVKQNGNVRICGDFKVTVNPKLKVDQYPLPLIDDIFASLAGGEKFSKIDLRSAYAQMEMTDESKPMLTLNTHRGIFRLNRLPFGIASAPAVWQRAIDTVLSGLSKTKCIIDDITGAEDEENFRILEAGFARLQAAGLRVNACCKQRTMPRKHRLRHHTALRTAQIVRNALTLPSLRTRSAQSVHRL